MEPTRARFDAVLLQWREATSHLSSTTAIAAHPFGRDIITMGRDAVPWLLERAKLDPCHCVLLALHEITGVNPIAPGDEGHFDKMTAAWVGWGQRRGYL